MASVPVGRGTASGGWFKSSFSNGQCACVEVRVAGSVVSIRDSKYLRHGNDPARQPIVTVSRIEFERWITAARTASLPQVSGPLLTAPSADGGAVVCHQPSGIVLSFTDQEWSAFVAGAKDDEFSLAQ